MTSVDALGQIMEKPAEFAPSTFAQRGVAVDFTTPLLVQSRIRQNGGSGPNGVELILPNLAGGKGSYILNWRSLTQFATITLHDHALYETVLKLDRIDPATVRTATLSVAAQGLAGRDAMRRAVELLEQEKKEALLTNFLLIADLLKLAGISTQELMATRGEHPDDNDARMKRAIHQVASTLQISPELLYQRIEVMTRSSFTVGLPWAPAPGRLRRLQTQLAEFADSAYQWQARDVTAAAEVGRFAHAVAVHTVSLARGPMGEVDTTLRNVLSVMRNWECDEKIISGHMSRLAWLLDGWSYIVSLWNSVAHDPHERQRDVILELARLIPTMPKEVSEWTNSGLDQEMKQIQRKWVRLNQDWRTGQDLRERIVQNELLKGAMA
jgi:hypothetical protein